MRSILAMEGFERKRQNHCVFANVTTTCIKAHHSHTYYTYTSALSALILSPARVPEPALAQTKR
jgi:hypothetical protein